MSILPAREMIRQELKRKQQSNPSFSLRAFARHLSMTPSRLSEIINGKRFLTHRQAQKILPKLSLAPTEAKAFLDSIEQRKLQRKQMRQSRKLEKNQLAAMNPLSDDAFFTIAEWQHFAIFSLLSGSFKEGLSLTEISEKLGQPSNRIKDCLARLQRLSMIEALENDRWKAIKHTWKYSVDSAAFRRAHAERLQLAMQSLENTPKDLREFASLTVNFNLSQIQKAKTLIQKMYVDFGSEIELVPGEEVYAFQIQFFPLSALQSASPSMKSGATQ